VCGIGAGVFNVDASVRRTMLLLRLFLKIDNITPVCSLVIRTAMTFSELIHDEEELLKRLLIVSERQLDIVHEGNVTNLIQHLGQRQQLWNMFEELEEQLAPHKKILPENRVWNNPEERQTTEHTLQRCKELMERILANDSISLKVMESQKNDVELQLRRVQQSSAVVPAYAKHSRMK
jgi:hypothetical protein